MPIAVDSPVLTRTFGENVAPRSSLTETKYSAELLLGELRASNQPTATLPVVWSTAMLEKNCEFPPVSSLTRTGALQVLLLSSEKRTKMFRSGELTSGASV